MLPSVLLTVIILPVTEAFVKEVSKNILSFVKSKSEIVRLPILSAIIILSESLPVIKVSLPPFKLFRHYHFINHVLFLKK